MSVTELQIKEDEHRKSKLNQKWKSKLADNIMQDQIKSDTWWQRLMKAPPAKINVQNIDKLYVVEDNVEQYPNFYKMLYCSLDYSLMLLYIMLFMMFELMWGGHGNAMLSIFLVYIVERILRHIRYEVGKNNLCGKSYVDKRFLS